MKIDYYDLRGILDVELSALIELILALFAESTGYVLAIYNNEGKGLWSKSDEIFSPLCYRCRKDEDLWKLCEMDHVRRTSEEFFKERNSNSLGMCHFGLWNISHPIYLRDEFFGALITGQRRLSSDKKIHQSSIAFQSRINELVHAKVISEEDATELSIAYGKVKVIDDFPLPLLEKLADIDKHLYKLQDKVLERVEKRVKRLSLLRHELHEPNMTLNNQLLRIDKQIDRIILNGVQDKDLLRFLQEAHETIRYTRNMSRIFSHTIENITSTLNREVLLPNFKRQNIFKVLDDSMKVFNEIALGKNVIFEAINKEGVYIKEFEMDGSLLMRAFINIYQNAVKYSFSGQDIHNPRTIRTKCRNNDDFFSIEVTNYGIGILKEELDEPSNRASKSIWAEGVRGKLSGDRERIGSGLGLPQIRQIINAHRGRVKINSIQLTHDEVTGPYLTSVIVDLPYTHD